MKTTKEGHSPAAFLSQEGKGYNFDTTEVTSAVRRSVDILAATTSRQRTRKPAFSLCALHFETNPPVLNPCLALLPEGRSYRALLPRDSKSAHSAPRSARRLTLLPEDAT